MKSDKSTQDNFNPATCTDFPQPASEPGMRDLAAVLAAVRESRQDTDWVGMFNALASVPSHDLDALVYAMHPVPVRPMPELAPHEDRFLWRASYGYGNYNCRCVTAYVASVTA
jgi:hypothetical protein